MFCSDPQSVLEAVELTKRFCEVTACAVNWSKCVGLWHGEWTTVPVVFGNVQWSRTPSKYLGVPLEHYREPTEYWREEIAKLKATAERWVRRDLSIFARATVCNVFLLSKLWYVLQVLQCSRINIQRIHRVFAVFIWASQWERTRRTNLFFKPKAGGVGLCHVFVRQLVSRFMFIRDQRDPFLRTVIQTRLFDVLPGFVVSSCRARCGPLSGFLREVVSACRFLFVRFSMNYLSGVSRKNLMRDLVAMLLPVPTYRSIGPGAPGDDVLQRVKNAMVPAAVKTFFFKLHSETLPVKTFLEANGMNLYWSVNCNLCKQPESIEHVFLGCWDALLFWDVLQRTIKKELPLSPQGIRFLTIEREPVPYDIIMLLGLHGIWKSRMAVRHADVDARSPREYFIETIKWLRECYKKINTDVEWLPVMDDLAALKTF
ncbi:unnamed protein product [Ixodes pacificus]